MTKLDNDLISRKALLEAFKNYGYCPQLVENFITNAPTIESEASSRADSGDAICYVSNVVLKSILDKSAGLVPIWYEKDTATTEALFTSPPKREWVSVEELRKLYDDMFRHKDIAMAANSLLKLIKAAEIKEVNHG